MMISGFEGARFSALRYAGDNLAGCAALLAMG
jgi:hypothetical protein